MAGALYSAGDLWLPCLVLTGALVGGGVDGEEEAGC